MLDEPVLAIEDLRVNFRRDDDLAPAVDGMSLSLGRGEMVCLVGESGCGKTVSALAIMGLIPVPPGEIAGGRILLNGENILDLGDAAMRAVRGKKIAMIFQEPLTSLNPVFTIGDQIKEAVSVHQRIKQDDLNHRVLRLLKDVGIPSPESRMHEYPHQLSGGQRQRVMIAMALACDPEVVIADEPTTALDVTVQAQILELLHRLREKRSMSTLYITHDLGVVSLIADRVYVMYSGIVVEQGTTRQIFNETMHPYTRGLLASLPDRTRRDARLESIPGSVPDPACKPGGCPFHPRCGFAVRTCSMGLPEMYDYGAGHLARCPVVYGYDSDEGRGVPEKESQAVCPEE